MNHLELQGHPLGHIRFHPGHRGHWMEHQGQQGHNMNPQGHPGHNKHHLQGHSKEIQGQRGHNRGHHEPEGHRTCHQETMWNPQMFQVMGHGHILQGQSSHRSSPPGQSWSREEVRGHLRGSKVSILCFGFKTQRRRHQNGYQWPTKRTYVLPKYIFKNRLLPQGLQDKV